MRAARYYGIAPWDLGEKPRAWVTWAIIAANAEQDAANRAAEKAWK